MQEQQFDIIVIGGGIQGAGCAQAATAAGYKVCMLEKSSWGSATSSHSSKLIHGGLRYLETYQFGLVRKALQERAVLMKIAGDLIRPIPFYIPIYRHTRHRSWEIFLGLGIYSLLGGFDRLARFRIVPENEWSMLSGLKTEGLERVFQYWDTQTDDLLLTRAVARSTAELGGDIREHADFKKASSVKDGYLVTYGRKGEEHQISCRVLINGAGPWVTDVQRRIENAPSPPRVELVQGAHIELEGHLSDSIFYLESPTDQRPMFVMPWHGNTLVGTTETAFSGDPARVKARQSEIDYLLEAVHSYFPGFQGRLLNSFAGLRVLPVLKKGFNERPRDTLIQFDDPRRPTCISLYGGKLTTYRATGAGILKKIRRTLGGRDGGLDTREILLPVPEQQTGEK